VTSQSGYLISCCVGPGCRVRLSRHACFCRLTHLNCRASLNRWARSGCWTRACCCAGLGRRACACCCAGSGRLAHSDRWARPKSWVRPDRRERSGC